MNIQAKRAREILQEIAKKTAKDIGYELGEIPKRTPEQIIGKNSNTKTSSEPSPIVEIMQEKTDNDFQKTTKAQKTKFNKDKEKIEDDIEKYRRVREKLQKEWDESQSQMEEDINLEPGQPLDMPTSKPSRGRYHPGKQKSPETRTSKR